MLPPLLHPLLLSPYHAYYSHDRYVSTEFFKYMRTVYVGNINILYLLIWYKYDYNEVPWLTVMPKPCSQWQAEDAGGQWGTLSDFSSIMSSVVHADHGHSNRFGEFPVRRRLEAEASKI